MELNLPPQGIWVDAPSSCFTQLQNDWLFRPGVFTEGLRQLGQLRLRVAAEYEDMLPASEAWMLQQAAGYPIWVREIVMSIDDIDCVFARSFTLLLASQGLWQSMRQLQTRPLGDILHHNPLVHRSGFYACRLTPQEPIYQSATRVLQKGCPPAAQILARCSIFKLSEQPLLVAECFLPEFWKKATHA